MRLRLVAHIPAPRRFTAITLPPFGIFIRADAWNHLPQAGRTRLTVHELIHWVQYLERGAIRYYTDYLRLWLKHGYRDHPMEIEARHTAEAV